MRFQKYAFSLAMKTHRSIRVHTSVLMRLRLSDRIALMWVELFAHATNIRTCDISAIFFILMRFWLSILIWYVHVFVLIHFKSVFKLMRFISVKTLSVLVWTEGLQWRIEMYTFSNENTLVWTEPEVIMYLEGAYGPSRTTTKERWRDSPCMG